FSSLLNNCSVAACLGADMEKRKIRILFADDEPSIRMTLPAILQLEGFEVSVAATVAEALAYINRETFDVLLADLNIGERGDGFTLISAMRRSQRSEERRVGKECRTGWSRYP